VIGGDECDINEHPFL
nr:RecName: Full=Thrombin-like enzyme BpSP-1; Short=SVTLE BpSP-1; AltName: Full=Fibrinogen-clotting enzyme; AltName: Full=Snake venom serine protease; Short=SVSP; AltName: Full=Thrombin-like enzyme BpSP-I; Short=SVTLE BpSP-I [Bothrops pauloensis]